ncbi:MAG: hypothetical protein M1831_004185 [Alyxoria varia]|nr:MAG: hypothetical protein M1831_004185 [Alyxoria varia]
MLDAYVGDQQNPYRDAPTTPVQYASAIAALVAPLSLGKVCINNTSASDPPIINPNWLADVRDQELAIAAPKRLRRLMNTLVSKKVVIGDEIYPGENAPSNEEILKNIKDSRMTVYHAAAT